MVQFHEHVISDLLEDSSGGGLVILSSGLALHKLIASLLLLHSPSQGTLLILSATPSQRSSITRAFSHLFLSQQQQQLNPTNLPSEITSELSSQHRHSLYSSSSIFFITSRILIVDLLSSKVPTSKIAGFLILNAHCLSETCTEAFIVRIFRSLNRTAYVRAFSDNPQSMVSGFAKVEKIMKCLFLRRLHLWPRFQVYISQDLERDPPTVVDIRVPMSPLMKGIQRAVIEVMDACLKEMRKTNKVDVDDLTVENGLFKSFDEILRRQLDPIWHTLGKKTKQLVSDLKTLRKLLDYLIRYDAVTFLRYLDTLRVSEGVRSIWMFADSSHKIFEFAKKRVYRLVHSDGEKLGRNKKSMVSKKRKVEKNCNIDKEVKGCSADSRECNDTVLVEVLEEAPKWVILREILQEIEEERRNQALVREGENKVLGLEDNNDIVLVACKDERSCMQLEDCIKKDPQLVMREEWEKYLLSKADLHGLKKCNKKKHKDPKGFGILNGVVSPIPRENADASSINKVEHNALLAAALEIRHIDKGETIAGDSLQPHASVEKHGKCKLAKENRKICKTKDADVKETRKTDRFEKSGSENEAQRDESKQKGAVAKGGFPKYDQEAAATDLLYPKPISYVHFYALESNQDMLDILRPSTIIVYQPDIAFVRGIEIYKSENPSKKLKIYFLFYEDSTELQKFEASIWRENGAFKSLIRQKSSMMIPIDQDGDNPLMTAGERQALTLTNLVTRKAGGRKEVEKEMQIIVDMREFMSSLPNVLHLKGMHIIPVTLEIGDYVLSPLICVERKSISDLFQSFASGRLYHQAETLVRYYKIPVLLIEFSQEKSFSFQSASDIGDDVTPTSIISKLSLLVLHFPRLRLVWSRSLHATSEIFTLLKANQDEPDETKATRVGVPMDGGIVENDVRAENYNTSAVEFLRRLPGVTDANYRALMDGCKSLVELALLPVERLAELMGGQNAARMLRDFMDAKFPTLR